jgi:hypothetical protein
MKLLYPARAILIAPHNCLALALVGGQHLLDAERHAPVDRVLAVAERGRAGNEVRVELEHTDLEARRPPADGDALLGQRVAQRQPEGVAQAALGLLQLLVQRRQQPCQRLVRNLRALERPAGVIKLDHSLQ